MWKYYIFPVPCDCIRCRAEFQEEENFRYHTTYRNLLTLSGRMTVRLDQVRFEYWWEKQKACGYSARHQASFSLNYNKFSVRHLGNNQSVLSNEVWFEICSTILLKVRLLLFRMYSAESTLLQQKGRWIHSFADDRFPLDFFSLHCSVDFSMWICLDTEIDFIWRCTDIEKKWHYVFLVN